MYWLLHLDLRGFGSTESGLRLTMEHNKEKTPRDESKMMSAEECARHIVRAIEKRKRELILTFVEGKTDGISG